MQHSYLWYFRDGMPGIAENSTSPEASFTDPWGSSAFAWAILSGIAGLNFTLTDKPELHLAPKWDQFAEESVSFSASFASISGV